SEGEPREDRDPDHEEGAERVPVDAGDALEQGAHHRNADAVPRREQAVRAPLLNDTVRVRVQDHLGPPRVPRGIARRGREARIGEEAPRVRDSEDEGREGDRPPRPEDARPARRLRGRNVLGRQGVARRHARATSLPVAPTDTSRRTAKGYGTGALTG